MRQWRLIYDSPTSGARNMAIDDAILTVGQQLPTLRFYAWQPPCLSLGYGQRAADVDFARLAAAGWDVVRRPTGGRAILHTDELTYSLILPADDPISEGGILPSYRRIRYALTAGLKRLGVTPDPDTNSAVVSTDPLCFNSPGHYEITVNGRKLIGSAQARRRGGVLQHGSLPLFGDLARICDALVYPDEAARELARAQVRARATTLAAVLRVAHVDWTAAADALASGFAEVFDVTFGGGPGQLSPAERDTADRLVAEVYSALTWTRRR
ncbi:MAG: lipoate--protein ligase family protein [Aggregatilineales bacterium]